jgi:23S rRNA G2445 N2-methylase RlmL
MWREIGNLMKRRFAGWRAVVLAGGPGLGKEIGLKPKRRIPVRNGPLEGRILVFDLY